MILLTAMPGGQTSFSDVLTLSITILANADLARAIYADR